MVSPWGLILSKCWKGWLPHRPPGLTCPVCKAILPPGAQLRKDGSLAPHGAPRLSSCEPLCSAHWPNPPDAQWLPHQGPPFCKSMWLVPKGACLHLGLFSSVCFQCEDLQDPNSLGHRMESGASDHLSTENCGCGILPGLDSEPCLPAAYWCPPAATIYEIMSLHFGIVT